MKEKKELAKRCLIRNPFTGKYTGEEEKKSKTVLRNISGRLKPLDVINNQALSYKLVVDSFWKGSSGLGQQISSTNHQLKKKKKVKVN